MFAFKHQKIVRYATRTVLLLSLLGVGLNATGLFDPNVETAKKIWFIAGMLPTLFFVAAIVMIDRAYTAIAEGETVETALSSLIARLGLCLFLGGIAFVFAQPLVTKVILGTSAWAWFDVPSITIGCLGLLLMIVAHPLREAAAMRAELDEFL